MSFFYLFFIGILIGTGMVIPGVSGSVIAVLFGIYNKMIYALNNLFKDFKKNFKFLFILALGIIIGAVWFSNILLFLYGKNEVLTKFCFIGLILGGVPYLFNEVKDNKNKINYIALIITLVISILVWYLSKNIIIMDINYSNKLIFSDYIKYILAGILYSVGKVVPGVSGSFLLIVIGMYDFVLSIMAHPITLGFKMISRVIPFIVGIIIGVIVLLKLMNYLLNKHFGFIYSIIIGFVLGSIPALIPSMVNGNNLIFGVLIMLISTFISYKLTKRV